MKAHFLKYSVVKIPGLELWTVNKGRKVLDTFTSKDAAEDYAQELVVDDCWTTNNLD